MPYPHSPFSNELNVQIFALEQENALQELDIMAIEYNHNDIFHWLCTIPKISSLRVNTLKYRTTEVLTELKNHFNKIQEDFIPACYIHSLMDDLIIIEHRPRILQENAFKEIIIDADCGTALLRGAHIFAPGVLSMMNGTREGDHVNIYVDLARKCKKGLSKIYEENKIFIGYGIVKMTRSQLFSSNPVSCGIAIEVTETLSGCPTIPKKILSETAFLLQNIPSVVCVYSMNPKPNDIILDMCAAPGNKTTHIASLTRNQGTIVAIDKTPKKIEQLENNCKGFGANVLIFQYDSRHLLCNLFDRKIQDGPPFSKNTFDKILLDAPCSALGKRPQFRNNATENVLKSYVPLQKKLFSMAVNLLKVGGTVVYSTCTITLRENEGIVAWALKKYDCLQLVKSEPYLGSPGLAGTSLRDDQLHYLQRFGPESDVDSVGFFIACFVKLR